MKKFVASSGVAASLLVAGVACAADAPASGPALVQAAPAAAPGTPSATAPNVSSGTAPAVTCGSLYDFFATSCPLTWYGVSVYGTVDMGVTYQSHGVPFNASSPTGLEYLLSKNSNRSGFHFGPNQLSQSNIGVKGNKEFLPGWAIVFDLEAGFDPYSLRLANGPYSVKENAGVPLNSQSALADSSRAGQFYNSLGYVGVSSPTYGTLTLFRQNSLTLDGVIAYDPLAASYAFSPIGYQGTTCGVGDTEDCRFTTAAKYRVSYGPVRAAVLYQFGGYGMNNGADSTWQFQAGGDIPNVVGGTVSLDGIYSRVKDAVALSLAGAAAPPGPLQTLTATISDDTSWMALARYTRGPVKLYGGYEWIKYGNPSDPKSSFSDISGDSICVGCAALNNTNINNAAFVANDKVLQVFWVGAKYAITDEWNVMAGYYEYLQNSYGAGTACGNATKATCSGMYNAFSLAVDYQFAAKFDAYAGIMYQTADGGLSNGFLHRNTLDPGIGVRFRF